ncbi:MAG: phospholipase D family protein [Archangiaceae bacterium]|nr:phospholipase D family protein [Archangiaceae bacterium]
MANARESVWISTANVKAMMIETGPKRFRPVVELFSQLTARGVEVRLLHAELPSRPFREAFDKKALLARRMTLKICPRVHFKCVLVDGAWLYIGSANLTGAGLGAKGADNRNFELGMVTEDFETIDQVAALYDRVWEGKPCKSCKLYAKCPDPIGTGPARRGSDVVLGRSRRLGR